MSINSCQMDRQFFDIFRFLFCFFIEGTETSYPESFQKRNIVIILPCCSFGFRHILPVAMRHIASLLVQIFPLRYVDCLKIAAE